MTNAIASQEVLIDRSMRARSVLSLIFFGVL